MEPKERLPLSGIIEKTVIVFVLGYGLHYFGYFLRARYFAWLETLALEEGISHALMYLGHTVFLLIMLVYALAVKEDRKYFLDIFRGKPLGNLTYALAGAVVGFSMMWICVFAAAVNGILSIKPASGFPLPLLVLSVFAVLVQASTEELESRAFVFGKMHGEGVPLVPAVLASSFFFSYLHAANPGFGLLPLLSIFIAGMMYCLSYYCTGCLWFSCTVHMMWNFTQDFIFGLPDSGRAAAVSLFQTTVKGSSPFFFDEVFGIEGSYMAILVNLAACVLIVLISHRWKKR